MEAPISLENTGNESLGSGPPATALAGSDKLTKKLVTINWSTPRKVRLQIELLLPHQRRVSGGRHWRRSDSLSPDLALEIDSQLEPGVIVGLECCIFELQKPTHRMV